LRIFLLGIVLPRIFLLLSNVSLKADSELTSCFDVLLMRVDLIRPIMNVLFVVI
jgi:hypothetical protein